MRKFLRFLLAGSFFSTVEEFLTVLILRQDLHSHLFTLFLLTCAAAFLAPADLKFAVIIGLIVLGQHFSRFSMPDTSCRLSALLLGSLWRKQRRL